MRFIVILLSFLLWPVAAFAQSNSLAPSATGVLSGAGQPVTLTAQLTEKGEPIERGLLWRVFGAVKGADGKLPLVASGKGGSQRFELPTGTYIVHTAFGRASATKKLNVADGGAEETFILDAGGLSLNAVADTMPIKPGNLRFSIYGIERDEEGNRALIVNGVRPGRIVRLKAGTYHVVSNYGDINASVRADLEVNAGEVTNAVLQHRGAEVTLKLVLRKGGDPVANTAWTVLSRDGEKLFESNAVSPRLVLSEGSYEASVRNGDEVYIHNFEVETGRNTAVEVLLD
ncbi:hypothetical protein ACFQ14_03985 [Pseudahrensia aquimaris]|uniref:Carboxypeptidase regulatory-like domain-containing protein n=1 Tax=Pseudahrensia aquimaris TaxID=744461 RepID=A0ABW3FAT2_9HYPH